MTNPELTYLIQLTEIVSIEDGMAPLNAEPSKDFTALSELLEDQMITLEEALVPSVISLGMSDVTDYYPDGNDDSHMERPCFEVFFKGESIVDVYCVDTKTFALVAAGNFAAQIICDWDKACKIIERFEKDELFLETYLFALNS